MLITHTVSNGSNKTNRRENTSTITHWYIITHEKEYKGCRSQNKPVAIKPQASCTGKPREVEGGKVEYEVVRIKLKGSAGRISEMCVDKPPDRRGCLNCRYNQKGNSDMESKPRKLMRPG